MINLKSISKTYKVGGENLDALNSINLTIKDGEFLSIIGPSGSGKSTLANIVGGLSLPTTGEVKIDNKELGKMSDGELSDYRNKTIGFVFQAFGLLTNYTCIENVCVPLVLANIGKEEREKRARECLKLVGLENREGHTSTQLSGGERQRVAIARALANKPRIIIADEPTGNLDSKKSAEIIALLRKLNKQEKMTLIIITHDKGIAMQADRTITIKDGKIS